MTNNSILPVIDLQRSNCIKPNQDDNFSQDMLASFIKTLPGAQAELECFAKQQNWQQLAAAAHKLLGACVYCGVPKLEHVTRQLEKTIKQEQTIHAIHTSYKATLSAINEVQAEYKRLRNIN